VTVAVPVDIRDLVGHPGASRAVHIEEPIDDMATELARVAEERPVEADLLMESLVDGILASGPVAGVMSLSCARCLKPFETGFRVDVQELFAPGATAEDDEYPLPDGGVVDVEPMIRDAVVLAMPFAPLCRPDCQGLCPRCGGDRNLGECTCGPETDERWAVLTELDLSEFGHPDNPDQPQLPGEE